MKQTLSDHDRGRLNDLIAETEKKTKTQIVLAVIQRSDSYAELPWKVFALGASIAGLLFFVLNLSFHDWYPQVTVLVAVASTLVCGILFALLTVIIPSFARQFLSADRAEMEVRQYADSLFLSRELFATNHRTGILMLVSLFERRIVILPDRGLENQLKEEDIQSVIAAMTPFLKRKEIGKAFENGLERLSRILGTAGPEGGENELPDDLIEEKGV
ncbi:TPM domain-containing protein [bacterium]|nr:TPM domain-containing protein [bacterium]